MAILSTQRGGAPMMNAYQFESGVELPSADNFLRAMGQFGSVSAARAQQQIQSMQAGTSQAAAPPDIKALPGANIAWRSAFAANQSARQAFIGTVYQRFAQSGLSAIEFFQQNQQDIHSQLSEFNSTESMLAARLDGMEMNLDVFKDRLEDEDHMGQGVSMTRVGGQTLLYGQNQAGEIGWHTTQDIALPFNVSMSMSHIANNPTLEDAIMPNKINVGSGITRLTSFITDAKAAQSATDNTWDNLESLSTGQRRTETNVNSLQEAILLSGNILNSEERESIYYELINNNVAKIAVIEPVVVSEGRTGRQVLSYRQKVDENNEPVFVDVRANPEEAINQQARNFSLNLALPMDEFDITTSNKFMGDIPAIVEYKLRRDEILANSFWTENNVAITPNNAHNFSSTIRLPVGHANIGTSGDIESIESLFNENGHGTSFQKARTFHTGQFIEEQLKLFQEGKQHDLIFQRDANNNIVRDRNNTPIIQGLTSQGQSKRDESFRNFVAEGKMTDFLEGPGQNVREGTAAGRFIRSVFGDGRNRQSSFVPIQSTVGVNMIPGEVRQSLNRYYNYSLPYDHPVRFGNSDVNFVRDITGNKPMPTVFADRVFSRTKFYNRDGTSYYAMAVEATTWVTRDQARRIGLPHITGGNNETEVMDRSNLRDLGINRERTTQRNIENIRKPGMTDAEALELQQRIRSGSQGDAVFEITVFVPIFNAEMLDRYTPQGNQNAKERVSLQSWITPNANELEAAGRSTGTLRQ